MNIIKYDELVDTSWKNGCVTREIATAQLEDAFLGWF
jgi:hypothetical protein